MHFHVCIYHWNRKIRQNWDNTQMLQRTEKDERIYQSLITEIRN